MMGVRSDIGPDLSHKNGPAMVRFLRIELAITVFESADHRSGQLALAAVCEILAPLVGFGIVNKQGQPFEVTGRAIGLNLFQLSAAIPNSPNHDSAVEFHPSGACGRLAEIPDVSLPSTNGEIKIVLAVSSL